MSRTRGGVAPWSIAGYVDLLNLGVPTAYVANFDTAINASLTRRSDKGAEVIVARQLAALPIPSPTDSVSIRKAATIGRIGVLAQTVGALADALGDDFEQLEETVFETAKLLIHHLSR